MGGWPCAGEEVGVVAALLGRVDDCAAEVASWPWPWPRSVAAWPSRCRCYLAAWMEP